VRRSPRYPILRPMDDLRRIHHFRRRPPRRSARFTAPANRIRRCELDRWKTYH
jgi:hypothetical protein